MELRFQNPVFNKGRNTTIRRGVKWDVCDKENVLIYDTGEPDPVGCVDISTRVKTFRDLTTEDIMNEHDPACRTYFGLLGVMQKVYPGFEPTEIVTIVDFEM